MMDSSAVLTASPVCHKSGSSPYMKGCKSSPLALTQASHTHTHTTHSVHCMLKLCKLNKPTEKWLATIAKQNTVPTFFHMLLEPWNKAYSNRTGQHPLHLFRCYCQHLVVCMYISQRTPDLRIQVLCHATLCCSASGSQNFKGMKCLHLQWSQRPRRMFNS